MVVMALLIEKKALVAHAEGTCGVINSVSGRKTGLG